MHPLTHTRPHTLFSHGIRSEADLEGIPIHHDRPANAYEKEKCTLELSRDEIARLVVGPKVCDCVCVSVCV